MPLDRSSYRTRVGYFYDTACLAQQYLSFLTASDIIPFFALLSVRDLADFRMAFIIFCVYSLLVIVPSELCRQPNQNQTQDALNNCLNTSHCNLTVSVVQLTSVILLLSVYRQLFLAYTNFPSLCPLVEVAVNLAYFCFLRKLLLLCSGDVESNPGPAGELCVMHLNARSLRDKIDLLRAEADKFDIITVSETWLSSKPSDHNDHILIQNFHPPERVDRPDQRYGGVAIYVKSDLVCKPRPDLHIPNLEAVWIETKLNQEKLLIGSFYRAPDKLVGYWDLVHQSVQKADDTMSHFIILGDFNSDFLAQPSPHLCNILTQHSLQQLVTFPTRITRNTRTCLDLILTQSPQLVKSVEDYPPFCSDHNVPYVILKSPTPKKSSFKRTIYCYDKLDQEKFTNLLLNENWNDIFFNSTVNDACNHFSDRLMEIAKTCMPTKTITKRSNDAPWFNYNIRTLINRRNKLYKKAKRTDSDHDWTNFKLFKQEVNETIKRQKIEYVLELNDKVCDPAKFKQKDWWKLVRTYLKKKGIDSCRRHPTIRSQQPNTLYKCGEGVGLQ